MNCMCFGERSTYRRAEVIESEQARCRYTRLCYDYGGDVVSAIRMVQCVQAGFDRVI